MNDFKPVYKTRAEAYRLFIKPQGLPVAQAKFYQDADRLGFVQANKTVKLEDLLAYVRTELQVNPATGQSLVERDRDREKQEWEIRKLKADVETKELANRKEDDKWLRKEEAYAQMAGIVGLLRDTFRHHFHLRQSALVHIAGGDAYRAPELYEEIEGTLAEAFNEVAGLGSVEVMFDGVED